MRLLFNQPEMPLTVRYLYFFIIMYEKMLSATYNCELSRVMVCTDLVMIKLKMCVSEPRKCSVHSCQSIHECTILPKILKKIFSLFYRMTFMHK